VVLLRTKERSAFAEPSGLTTKINLCASLVRPAGELVRLIGPVSWLEHPEELGLERVRGIHRRIVPRRYWWKAHEHALDSGTGLQAKQSAAIVHEIEFRIAPPSHQLEVSLPLSERKIPPPVHDGTVRPREATPHALDELEERVEIESAFSRPQMIEEDAADTAAFFIPVRVHEVMVAPRLEAGIEIRVVALAHRLQRPVKVDSILRERVCRCKIGSTTEPGVHPLAARIRDFEVTDIEVNSGNHRAAWVRDDAHPGYEEGQRFYPDAMRSDPLRESGFEHAIYGRSVDTCLFVGLATREHAAQASATAGSLPLIFPECSAPVQLAEEYRGLFVQTLDPGGDPLPQVSGYSHRERHSLTALTNACA